MANWTVSPEEQDILWRAILDRVDELTADKPHSRSQGYYSAFGSRGHCRCIATVHNDDGTSTVYDLEATRNSEYPADKPWGKATITVKTYRDDHDAHWQELAEKASDGLSVVVDHVHYRIVPDRTDRPDHCRGFGGREFTVQFHDGRMVKTRNLWHQGTISPSWRDRLPDNAVFVSADYVEAKRSEPDPADPHQIAVSLMNDAARELNPDEVQAALAEHGIEATSGGYHVRQILELAATADITIGWNEEAR